jgi:DNA repair exonuclease SbcCD ATPase subunit
MSNATTHQDSNAAAEAPGLNSAEHELNDVKTVVIESGEMATRAAGLAAKMGGELKLASQDLLQATKKQRKQAMILLGIAAGFMLLSGLVFSTLSMVMQRRVKQLDEMVLAVGKRVVEMDASLESVASVQESLKGMVEKQEELADAQTKLDAKLEGFFKTAEALPAETAKQVDAKLELVTKEVHTLDAKLQADANAIRGLSNQVQGVKGAVTEVGDAKRNLETLARQLKERSAMDNTTAAAAASAKAKERERDKMLQYPRMTMPEATKPADAHSSDSRAH